jgi:hypothetical protein
MDDYYGTNGAMSNIPPLTDLLSYANFNPNTVEGVRQSQYDFNFYATAGVNQLLFFQVPQGAGQSTAIGTVAGATKTAADTSMSQNGMLPSPQVQLCTSIELIVEPGSVATANVFTPQVAYSFIAAPAGNISLIAVNDVNLLRQSGWLNLFIGTRNMLIEGPIGRFPPKTALALDVALSTNSATVGIAAAASSKWGGRPYYLDPPLALLPSVNFLVQLNWPNVVATPSGFNARIGVIIDGYLYRNS